MEKEYINALLGDIEKSVVPDEKIGLLTILTGDLVQEIQKQNEVITSLKETLDIAIKAQQAWFKTSEVMGEAVVKTRDHLVEVSQNLAGLGETVCRMAVRENQQAKMNLKKIESDSDSLEKIYDSITNLYNHIDHFNERLNKNLK